MRKLFAFAATILFISLLAYPASAQPKKVTGPIRLTRDAFRVPKSSIDKYKKSAKKRAGAPPSDQTSTFMIGSTAIRVIFVQSTGALKTEPDWTLLQMSQVTSEIQEGLNWWQTKYLGTMPALSFNLLPSTIGTTNYEPIDLPASSKDLWISEIMNSLEQTGADYSAKVRNYDNTLRSGSGTDWAFTIFVVNDVNDGDKLFADGLFFAYAYLGGPFMVMTYDNDGYGIGDMNWVFAHELGHIFYALDEYASSGASSTDRSGYLYEVNGNFLGPTTCIMQGDVGNDGVCLYTKNMIGWRDSDGDGIFDPADTAPSLSVPGFPSSASGSLSVSGTATDVPYPSAATNPAPNDPIDPIPSLTINKITNVAYNLDSGVSQSATPQDGSFNSSSEGFVFGLSGLATGSHLLAIASANSVNNSTLSSFNFGVDVTAPLTAITLNPPTADGGNGWYRNAPVVTLASNEPGTTYYRWDAGNVNTYTSAFSATEGSHSLSYWSMDQAGNAEAAKQITIKVDSQVPVISLITPANGAELSSSTPLISCDISDALSGPVSASLSLDDVPGLGTLSGGKLSYQLASALSDGSHTVVFSALDLAGNAISETAVFTVDTTPPSLKGGLTRIQQNPPGKADYVFGLAGTVEPFSTIRIYSGISPYNLIGTTTALGDGSFPPVSIGSNKYSRISVVAIDKASNQSPSVLKLNDISSPWVTYASLKPFYVKRGGKIYVTFKAVDNTARARIQIKVICLGRYPKALLALGARNSGVFYKYGFYTRVSWPKGGYVLQVIARDSAGNLAVKNLRFALR